MSTAAQAHLDDQAARDRIRRSLGESLLVEAAAGTGKTTELVRRLTAVLEQGLTTVDSVVAVTFTRKAAGELKLRLRQELDNARQAATGAVEKQHLEDALERLEEARVGTIHSFCAELLRERPVEAEIDPAFEELSEGQSRRLYARAFRAWMQEKLGAASPGLRRILGRLTRPEYWDTRTPRERLQDAGWKLIEWRDFPAPWRREPFDREGEIDAVVGQLQPLAAVAAQCANAKDALAQGLRPVQNLATWIARAEREGGPRDYDALEVLLVRLPSDLNRASDRKGKGPFAPGVTREAVVALRSDLIAALRGFQKRADADLAALLRTELWDLVERYEKLKAQAGALDFVDLLIRVRQLLRENAEVRQYFQEKFTHIFVDEFQDTDPLQAEILVLLSADDPAQRNWLEARPVAGKLFLVGDPKQSIYRFRRADVLLYQTVRDALAGQGVGVVYLARSFRALPAIQDFVNAAFESEIQEDAHTGQPRYVPLLPKRPGRHDQPAVIALPVAEPFGGRRVTKKAVNASLPATVAGFVEWLVRESGWTVEDPGSHELVPLRERHVCLLFRHFIAGAGDSTRDFLHALEACDIPHVLVGARSFHQREEVETLRTALTAVEWPGDELAVFATLKGSLFALPDDLLLRFHHACGSFHPFRPLPQPLDPDFQPVAEALEMLACLHRGRNYRPVAATLSELLEATRAHAGFALRPAGHQILGNVARVAELARNFELDGGISFRSFVEELAEQADRVSHEAPVLEEGADGVRIMTVHTAKGLEFPVVILADITTRLSRQEPDLYVDTRQGVCATALVGCAPWDLLDHQPDEALRDRAEGTRVCYVAATRARDLLVVPAVGDEPLSESWLEPLHKALYPARDFRRRPSVAPGCPAFGEYTVLRGPSDYPGGLDFSIRPGLHVPQQGSHGVVWWDPAQLHRPPDLNLGLRLDTVLAEDPGGVRTAQGLAEYEEWQRQRENALQAGVRPHFNVFAATDRDTPVPPETSVEFAALPRPEDRPGGRRFGTLVHTILRDAALAPDRAQLALLARVHARASGATTDEIEAAGEAAAAALAHPWLERARAAVRCHRELPLLARLEDGRLLEAVLDLAFLEDGIWTIVDFKTDAHLVARRADYERQLRWYAAALSRLTGLPTRACLLGI
jgi:ATP-dependent helicase/nuclease subunit A